MAALRDDVKRWAELAEAATKAPWHGPVLVGPDDVVVAPDAAGPQVCGVGNVSGRPSHSPRYERVMADAAFIAASREAVPEMAALLVAAMRELEGVASGEGVSMYQVDGLLRKWKGEADGTT